MTDYSNYLIIVLGLLFIGISKYVLAKKQQKSISGAYAKKNYLITEAERKLFECLQQAVGEQYYIFPQVNLDKFLLVKGEKRNSNFHKINQKSVDFLLCDKQSLTPSLAIELNDNSHNKPNRVERDQFISEVFKQANLPFLIIPWKSSYNIESLRSEIIEKIA